MASKPLHSFRQEYSFISYLSVITQLNFCRFKPAPSIHFCLSVLDLPTEIAAGKMKLFTCKIPIRRQGTVCQAHSCVISADQLDEFRSKHHAVTYRGCESQLQRSIHLRRWNCSKQQPWYNTSHIISWVLIFQNNRLGVLCPESIVPLVMWKSCF